MSSATPNNPYDALASEVLPGLYIASSRVARNEQLLCDLGITLIVNCAFECPNHLESTGKFDYVNCYLTDEPDELLWPTYEANGVGRRIVPSALGKDLVDATFPCAAIALARGGKVLVHCQAGVSRSTAILAMFLMEKKKMPLKEALALIRAARPIVLPNPGYLKQLTQELELKILGSSSMTPQSNEFTAAVSVEPVSAS